MDRIDMEIQGMLEKIKSERYTEFDLKELDEIESIVRSFVSNTEIPLESAVDRELTVRGAVVNLMSGFDIFTDEGKISGTFFNSTATRLEIALSKTKGTAYHNKDGRGQFIYVFPDGIKLAIRLRGRFRKWYDFEVLNE